MVKHAIEFEMRTGARPVARSHQRHAELLLRKPSEVETGTPEMRVHGIGDFHECCNSHCGHGRIQPGTAETGVQALERIVLDIIGPSLYTG